MLNYVKIAAIPLPGTIHCWISVPDGLFGLRFVWESELTSSF